VVVIVVMVVVVIVVVVGVLVEQMRLASVTLQPQVCT